MHHNETETGMKKLKAAVAGIAVLVVGYPRIRFALGICASMIRVHWRGAWFTDLVEVDALLLAMALSLCLGWYVFCYTLKNHKRQTELLRSQR
jgi:hypothetical protein